MKDREMIMPSEWQEGFTHGLALVTGGAGRVLFVEDGTVGHYATLAAGEDVASALDDYAAGHDYDPQTVEVRWYLFEDGEEVDKGRHSFDVR
jgi:hypothetical protein